MELVLQNRQVQGLSQAQIQKLQILQYSMSELVQFIQEQSQSNVMLEIVESAARSGVAEPMQPVTSSAFRVRKKADGDDEGEEFFPGETQQTSLHDEIMLQLSRSTPRALRSCISFLANCLDENGYLSTSLQEITERTTFDRCLLEEALERIQKMEPAGIGARSLSECLCLQLERDSEDRSLAITIARSHLNELSTHQYSRIARQLGCTVQDAARACTLIRQLDPRPAMAFVNQSTTEYIIPDYVVTLQENIPVIQANNAYVPELRMNEYYDHLLHSTEDQELISYLRKHKENANWVLRSLEQRKNTVEACVRTIVQMQLPFFLTGRAELIPVTLSAMAEQMSVHVSTLSRAVRGKYIQTDFGTFPMSHFFSSASFSNEESEVSNKSVRIQITNLIQQEDKHSPLSDHQIAHKLAEMGIDISRRTVAKYREQLGIFPANVRRVL